MNTQRLLIVLFIGVLTMSLTSCESKSKIFTTFASRDEVGNIGDMVFDGRYYWFRGLLGPSFCYDSTKNNYKQIKPQKEPDSDPILSMEVVNGNVWFGLRKNGVAFYDPKIDNFKLMTYKDGLPYYLAGEKKYSRVSALAFDKFKNIVWAGTIEKGLALYDLASKKWTVLKDPTIKDTSIIAITVSEKVVIVSADKGLYIQDKSSNTWKSIGDFANKLEYDNIVVDNDNVYFVSKSNDETIISVFNIKTGEIKELLSSNNDISYINLYDKYLVYCTNQGVTFFNLNTKKEKTFDTSDGIVSNWVNSVYIEGENMWVLTQDGISKGKIKDVMKELTEIN